jgi:hypothetical protein
MFSSAMSKKLQLPPGQKTDMSLILDCCGGVLTTLKPFWNKWIFSDVWVEIINSRYDLSDDLMFPGKELTAVIARIKVYKSTSIEITTMANQLGLYKAWTKKRDKDRKNSTIVAYYCTSPDTLLIPPGGNSKWYDDIVSLLPRITSRSSDKTHSCGHDRQQPYGLSVLKVNKSFGGAQSKMRRSKIEADEFIGPFLQAIHQVGDYQYMVFQDGDPGPFNLSKIDQVTLKFDCVTGEITTKNRKKDALEKDLRAKEVRARGNREDPVKLCKQHDIPHEISWPAVLSRGVGQLLVCMSV